MARSDFRFFYPFRIRYSEIDGQKIVFNAHYLTFFDTALMEYMEAIGYSYTDVESRTGHDYHTVRNLIDYHQPVYLREDIEVGVRPGRVGNSSITFVVEIHPAGKDDLRTSGEVVWVYTNQASGKSEKLPQDFLDLLDQYEKG